MTTGIDALFCQTCGGYVHPFLDSCPTCGSARPPRYEEAVRGNALGLASLPGDPDLRARATALARTNTLVTSRGFPAFSGGPDVDVDEQADLPALLNALTGTFQYRVWLGPGEAGPGGGRPVAREGARTASRSEPGSIEGRLQVDGDRVTFQPARAGTMPMELPLASIRSIGTVHGRTPGDGGSLLRPPRGAEIAVTVPDAGASEAVFIGNPGGIFATKARSDHFRILAWWLGVLAGVTAERRWMAVGVPRHAAEIGLRGTAMGDGQAPSRDAAIGAGEMAPAIDALDRLRAAGLLSPTEYEAKLRELRSRATTRETGSETA